VAKRYIIALSDEERSALKEMLTKGKAAAKKLLRARAVLLADEGLTDVEICDALGIGTASIERWRKRFVTEGLEAAIAPKPQPRAPRTKLDGRAEARLIALACSPPPPGRARWTLRLLAGRLVELRAVDTISYETVRQALKKKRAQAVARSSLVHHARKERGIRVRDGRRSGGLSSAL
jgi:transposase